MTDKAQFRIGGSFGASLSVGQSAPTADRQDLTRAQRALLAQLEAYEEAETIGAQVRGNEPKRAPLPGYGKTTPFDPFPGFITKTSTTEQPRQSFLCDSPDLLPASHQFSPHFGSASLKG